MNSNIFSFNFQLPRHTHTHTDKNVLKMVEQQRSRNNESILASLEEHREMSIDVGGLDNPPQPPTLHPHSLPCSKTKNPKMLEEVEGDTRVVMNGVYVYIRTCM